MRRQRVQMLIFLISPSITMRRLNTFGLNMRLVARIEWLRLWPNCGPLPQTEHLAMIVPVRINMYAPIR